LYNVNGPLPVLISRRLTMSRPQGRDPNDEMVLEAAINGRADVLVTYNLADFVGVAERFRISVMHPADLLKNVKIR
jgi:predicted nucleic acid-binding protein